MTNLADKLARLYIIEVVRLHGDASVDSFRLRSLIYISVIPMYLKCLGNEVKSEYFLPFIY